MLEVRRDLAQKISSLGLKCSRMRNIGRAFGVDPNLFAQASSQFAVSKHHEAIPMTDDRGQTTNGRASFNLTGAQLRVRFLTGIHLVMECEEF